MPNVKTVTIKTQVVVDADKEMIARVILQQWIDLAIIHTKLMCGPGFSVVLGESNIDVEVENDA